MKPVSAPTPSRSSGRFARCSVASEARGEPIAGTASTVRSWLLLEHAGPWGRDAFVDGRHVTGGFGLELATRCRRAGVRPLLIRRVSRSSVGGASCFAIVSGPGSPLVERTTLASLDDALGLDLEALGRGRSLGLEPHGDPLFLVCTHGRRDTCCAERGRPVAQALATAEPNGTWECSHIGGDRFAGNVLAFPHGIYFGHVEPDAAAGVARAYAGGRLSLEHVRGRSSMPMPAQFADVALRRHLGLEGVDDVAFVEQTRDGDRVEASFETVRGWWTVRLEVTWSEPQLLTCHSVAPERAPVYSVAAIEPG